MATSRHEILNLSSLGGAEITLEGVSENGFYTAVLSARMADAVTISLVLGEADARALKRGLEAFLDLSSRHD